MTRFKNIPQYEDFFKSLKLTLTSFSLEHNVTRDTYFADKLFISSSNQRSQFSNLINVGTGKDLKVREFLLLLDNSPQHQKHTLDYLCDRYNLICSQKATYEDNTDNTKYENIKDLLINISCDNGNLLNDFVSFYADKQLTLKELKQLKKQSYDTRSSLVKFEDNIQLRIDVLEVKEDEY